MKKLLAILMLVALLAGCSSTTQTETVPSESTEATTVASAEGTTEATEPVELPEMEILGTPGFGNNDVLAANHYTVMEADPADSNMTAIIAVAGENVVHEMDRHTFPLFTRLEQAKCFCLGQYSYFCIQNIHLQIM